jgi:Icc-related predicted phosphoesterase
MKLRLLHMSDTHGYFPKIGRERFDAVIHTGDLLPDPASLHDQMDRAAFQSRWVENHIEDFQKMLDGKPLLFTLGNHDFIPPDYLELLFNQNNIKAISLEEKVVPFEGFNFYGFPFINSIDGSFNYERTAGEMSEHADKMVIQLNEMPVDVIAAHAPISGCLDLAYHQNMRYGNAAMGVALDYKIDRGMRPDYYLCGHIHNDHGITMRDGMLISNAATTYHLIEVLK